MSNRKTIPHFLLKIRTYLIPRSTESDLYVLVSKLMPYLTSEDDIDMFYEIGRTDSRRGVIAAMDMFLEIVAHLGVDAFRVFVNVILYNNRFLEIRSQFLNDLSYFGLDEFQTHGKSQSGIKPDDPIYGDKRIPILTDSFKKFIVGNSTEEEKLNFKKSCVKLLDSGFVFKFVMLNAIIDDLISRAMPSTVALKEAKVAIHNMLPYALNLCRSPNRKEYRVVKKYTAHYLARIKNNLKCSQDIADSILECMGYRSAEYPDEVVLDHPSKSILEIAFELYLCELKLISIISMVGKLTTEYNMPANKVLIAWLKFTQTNGGKATQKEVLRYVKDNLGVDGMPSIKGDNMRIPSSGVRGEYDGRSIVDTQMTENWMYHDVNESDEITNVKDTKNYEAQQYQNMDFQDIKKDKNRIQDNKPFDEVENIYENKMYGSVLPIKNKGKEPLSLVSNYRSNCTNKNPTSINEYGDYANMIPASSMDVPYMQSKANTKTMIYEPPSDNRTNKNPTSMNEYGDYANMIPASSMDVPYMQSKANPKTIMYEPPSDDFQLDPRKSRDSSLTNTNTQDSVSSVQIKGLNPKPDSLEALTDYSKISAGLRTIADDINSSKKLKIGLTGKQKSADDVPRESVYENYNYSSYSASYNEADYRQGLEIPATYSNVDSNYKQQKKRSTGQVMSSEFASKGMPAIYQQD